jgi:TPP-dependent pyruvate/acetoin dehydrogenase alpha subunit
VSDAAILLERYRQMFKIRLFEETALRLRQEDRVYGTMHPYIGQEAIAVGVSAALESGDRIVSNHRGHGHLIARGADLRRMMAELLGREDGYCRGRGGSMHIADFDLGILGANGIVAAGLPIAVGSAIQAQVVGAATVTVGFFGDGATGEGAFHESLNISSLEHLPVVWVCENNQYADRTPASAALPTGQVATYADAYGIPGVTVDGTDVSAVEEAARVAVDRARRGDGPTLVECVSFRLGVHAQRRNPVPEWRPPSVIEEWRQKDPLTLLETRIVGFDPSAAKSIAEIRADVAARIDDAVAFAEASPFPDPESALAEVFA